MYCKKRFFCIFFCFSLHFSINYITLQMKIVTGAYFRQTCPQTRYQMKTILKTLLIVIMMVIDNVSADAIIHAGNTLLPDCLTSQNTEVGPKKKCTLFHIHTEECGGKYVADRTRVYPGMNKRLRHHILKGNHKWHRDVCTRCHLTKNEVRKMEVEVRKMESEMHKAHYERTQARNARHKVHAERHKARVERHKAHRLKRHNIWVEKRNTKAEKHNAKVERHKAHELERQNAKAEKHNAKVERQRARTERRELKKNKK